MKTTAEIALALIIHSLVKGSAIGPGFQVSPVNSATNTTTSIRVIRTESATIISQNKTTKFTYLLCKYTYMPRRFSRERQGRLPVTAVFRRLHCSYYVGDI